MPIKEILVLHHSHLDIGYTHSQPVIWELHREYLDLALDLLEQTADWPETSRPKWTCEVTAPVLKWLETATAAGVARFTRFIKERRLAIGAMRYNTTPLNTAAQLARQLAPVAELRRRFGASINTALQHDVNGVPWPLADLLLEHGILLFVMGVNRHLGNPVPPRPGVFRWRTPSGRVLRVMNGNHYTMFDQILLTWERSLDSMQRGLAEYVEHLRRIDYPHDFLYLTMTAALEMWDNSPPNLPVVRLIRQWNEAGREPRIRYVTTEDLAERILRIPDDQLPLLSGDWTDYWNFGCASTAGNVARSRAAKRALDTADRLAAAPRPAAVANVAERARDLLDLFDEHTWGYWDTAGCPEPSLVQHHLKATPAIEARELASYVLTHELESLAGNPAQSEAPPDHVLFVNPAPVARCEYVDIPAAWRKPGPRLRCERFTPGTPGEVETVGPIQLPPFGTQRVPLASLKRAADDTRVRHEDRRTPATFRAFKNVRLEIPRHGDALLESPTHRLTYDPATGRILGLFDKVLNWDVLPAGGDYSLFEFVRERPDALADGRREAYYERDL
ncbi:MAG: glycoside hydrolase, partial [Chloroflexi bacterium]|nr:glycoside hydrolase [Chloroflexota bacterium]